jgi:hypothetical protein
MTGGALGSATAGRGSTAGGLAELGRDEARASWAAGASTGLPGG